MRSAAVIVGTTPNGMNVTTEQMILESHWECTWIQGDTGPCGTSMFLSLIDSSRMGKPMRPFTCRKAFRAALSTMVGLLLGACANSGFQLSDAAISGIPAAMWEEGQRAATAGEGLVSKGEKHLADGQEKIREGEAMIANGNQQVLEAKRDYVAAAANVGGSATPLDVTEESKRLRAIGKRWEEAIGAIRHGNKLVDQGNKNIAQGQAEIREGRSLIEQGSTLMRNAQRSRLGMELLPEPAGDLL